MCCSPRGRKGSDATEQLNSTELTCVNLKLHILDLLDAE